MKDVRALGDSHGRRDAATLRRARVLSPAALSPTPAAGVPRAERRPRTASYPKPPRLRGGRAWLLWGIAASLSALAVVGIGELLSRADALPLQTVAVRGVDGALADEVRAYAALPLGTPTFAVRLEEVAARVTEHPYVRAAEVRRLPPDAVEIEVRVRSATALLAASSLYLVDELGEVFKSARPGDGLDLPLITGLDDDAIRSGAASASLSAALELLRAHAAAGAPGGELSEVHVEQDGALTLVVGAGVRVHMGCADGARGCGDVEARAKLARLAVVVQQLSSAGQQALSIRLDDERRPERAAVRLRAGSEAPSHGG